MGQILGGRLELVDPIADGAMGSVWRVWDRRDQAYRAGKVLRQADSTSLLRFVRETGHRIDHPHVVAPLSWCGEDDQVVFTMPLVRGGSLDTVMADNGPLPLWWVAGATGQLLDALAAVHARRLVHRDVKPANILLEPTEGEPFVRLGDFGIAARVDDPRLTGESHVVGTPGYLSPEALAGAGPDPRQDLYAVGVVVVQMLTGHRPSPPDLVPPAVLATPLGPWVSRLVGPVDERGTAASARESLLALGLPDGPRDASERVDVFDQVPVLPPGWGPHGPLASRGGGARVAAAPVAVGTRSDRDTVGAVWAGEPSTRLDATGPSAAVPAGRGGAPGPSWRAVVDRFGALALSLVGAGLVLLAAALYLL